MQTVAGPSTMKQARQLAGAIDALVRGTRSNPVAAFALAQRVIALWRELPGIVFEVTPDTMALDGVAVFRADAQVGRWLLPAFMAGIHSIGIADERAAALGLQALAHELSGLTIDMAALSRFSSWVWGEGAEGLALGLGFGILEVGSARERVDQKTQSDQLRLVRATPAFVGDDENDTLMNAGELDRAAVLEELSAPLELFARSAASNAFALGEQERLTIGRAVNDLEPWLIAELRASIEGPACLVERLPATRIARNILGRLESTVVGDGDGLAVVLLRLMPLRDQRADVWQCLIEGGLADVIGRRLQPRWLHQPSPLPRSLVTSMLESTGLAVALIDSMLSVAISDDDLADLGRLGARALLALEVVTPTTAARLARAVALGEPGQLGRFVAALPPATQRIAVTLLPSGSVRAVRDVVIAALQADKAEDALLLLAAASGDAVVLRSLIQRIGRNLARDVPVSVVRVAFETAVDHEDLAAEVARLATKARTPRAVKIIALNALMTSPVTSARARASSTWWERFEDVSVTSRRRRLRETLHMDRA